MGKRKRERANSLSATRQFGIEFFKSVWKHISGFTNAKARFALQWMWENENVMKLFATRILGMKDFSKSMLVNGYRDCKDFQEQAFTEEAWATIDSVFAGTLSMKHLPGPVRTQLYHMNKRRGLALLKYWRKQVVAVTSTSRLSRGEVEVKMASKSVRRECPTFFMGDWDREGIDLVAEKDLTLCKHYPQAFKVLQTSNNITYVYDRSGRKPFLVGMVMKHKLLTDLEKEYIRSLLAQLFVTHNEIERDRSAALTGAMVGFGPFYHSRIKNGGKKISFYKPVKDSKDLYQKLGLTEQFSALVDRQAHGMVMEIIIGLFLTWCPTFLQSFFEYGDPYLAMKDYEPMELERELQGKGAAAYQMYVTENYCSSYHVDADESEFTLCYASHPDASSTSPIDFVLSDYGLRLPIEDGDLFAFRSDYGHATGYRRPTQNAAYVGAIAVNTELRQLMQRRKFALV